MQRRFVSLLETCTNTAIGFGLSLLVWITVIVPVWHLPVTMGDNLTITCIFTVVSIVRGYVLRRVYNWLTVRGLRRA